MVGPTEFVRGGKVIETERLLVTEGTGTGVPEGDGALGRLFLFSAKVKSHITIIIIVVLKSSLLVGGKYSRNAIRTLTRSIASSRALNRR